jgi:hypothetical protein
MGLFYFLFGNNSSFLALIVDWDLAWFLKNNFDWKAGVHTPRLAARFFIVPVPQRLLILLALSCPVKGSRFPYQANSSTDTFALSIVSR